MEEKDQYDANICGLRCVVSGYDYKEATHPVKQTWAPMTIVSQLNGLFINRTSISPIDGGSEEGVVAEWLKRWTPV